MKLLIMGIMIFIFGISLTIILFVDPLFESEAKIAIGYLPFSGFEKNTKLIENPKEIKRRILGKHKNIGTVQNEFVGIISLKANGLTGKNARDNLSVVVQEIMKEHENIFNKIFGEYATILKSYQNTVKQIELNIGFLKKISYRDVKISEENSLIVFLVSLEKLRLQEQLINLQKDILILQQSMSEVYMSPTRLIQEPSLPKRPIRPRTAKYLMISIFLGFALGIFAAVCETVRVNLTTQLR